MVPEPIRDLQLGLHVRLEQLHLVVRHDNLLQRRPSAVQYVLQRQRDGDWTQIYFHKNGNSPERNVGTLKQESRVQTERSFKIDPGFWKDSISIKSAHCLLASDSTFPQKKQQQLFHTTFSNETTPKVWMPSRLKCRDTAGTICLKHICFSCYCWLH